MEKPQWSEREEKGEFGQDYVRSIIKSGWRGLVQPVEGVRDRGIDFVVLDVLRSSATGYQFNIQVKTSDYGLKYRGDSFPVKLERKHIELWRDSNVPVVLVCVDVGPPPVAFWKLIRPGENVKSIRMERGYVLHAASRDAVIAEILRAFPKPVQPAMGEVLDFPLHSGIRDCAKNYYYQELMKRPQPHPLFGPIEFTWKGWRHLTRRSRSLWKILMSLQLLPSVRAVLDGGGRLFDRRVYKPVRRGAFDHYKTLLVFNRVVEFAHRVPAWVQIAIEVRATIPVDFTMRVPYDPSRKLSYKFFGLTELADPVKAGDLSS